MLNKIISFSIKHKLIIALFTLGLVVWGIWSASRLPVDAVPDITNNQVQVITRVPNLAAQETEQLVTYPIEQTLANIPGLVELRSISRFGLSVITAVFDEDVNVYFARQLINEKLNAIGDDDGFRFGKPELAPVTTGLGEIYQYVLHPVKGAEHKYSAMDLRTMQDWIIARQLYGTPGVAEVNSFGGLQKQYEVAVDPNRLNGMQVTLGELFDALEKNNANTGGAYIDKKPNAYYIRGVGAMGSMEDIRNTLIKSPGGIPVLVRDVAKVQEGSAVRYGSVTYNGEKEVVGGIVMMLKGENSASVVSKVKDRIAAIQKTVPADVVIEPYLDRAELVKRAISTVSLNLVEGALIVIFVLVLFLGNMRAGLIVASAIPLSMLFALGMMNLFGVSANLMSLGAIDFGLIVDGAVIVVEATLHHLKQYQQKKLMATGSSVLTRAEKDKEVFLSASGIRKSAAFGEIIILIVYIPVLTLVGIEGKMFRPMAQTVSFAILGALILSLTYVPMMSALLLPGKLRAKPGFSDRMMHRFQRIYSLLLSRAIRTNKAIVVGAVALLALSAVIFSRMGGEFIPQLQEGDFAIHCILPQGTSLSQSVETSMQASRILRTFPEVKMVVGKTGSAEVPTDPMPPEGSDLMVSLKPRSEWPQKKSYDELAEQMMEKLELIPGAFFEVSQPIQMRFNELMTGVRQDVAVKIFGENIDSLAAIAPRVAGIVSTIEGSTGAQVEQTTGLPQITVKYDRARLAAMGVSIDDVNRTISTSFAGERAGVIYENERKFDLVVRLDSANRTSINDVSNLFVATGNGSQVPLHQVADISFKTGPAQISREDGKRRIVVGFNVRNRDVESVVHELQDKLEKANLLPVGYYYTYGGTFENFKDASARLQIAVPVALVLIFLLLYFTFGNMKDSLLIYTAIPMSAIGGVFALWLRGMPFSISAGVGFIALFGVAVLNGIVLISTFRQLEKSGVKSVLKRVYHGTRLRLRPVLMTAAVASLGFAPMAFSTGAGAEVQKPLATVVIGGLVTATLLTLFVLPVLYMWWNKKRRKYTLRPSAVIVLLIFLMPTNVEAQTRISANEALERALANNLQFNINDAAETQSKHELRAAAIFPKTGVFVENEDINPQDKDGILKIGVSQSVEWPGVYKARRKLFSEQLQLHKNNRALLNLVIGRETTHAYYELWYQQEMAKLFTHLDSLYEGVYDAARVRVRTGEAAALEQMAAEAKWKENKARLRQQQLAFAQHQQLLSVYMNIDSSFLPADSALPKLNTLGEAEMFNHPELEIMQQQIRIAEARVRVENNLIKPEFSGRVFSQRLYGVPDPFTGFSISMAVPVFGMKAYRQRIDASKASMALLETRKDHRAQQIALEKNAALNSIEQFGEMLSYYEETGNAQAKGILDAAQLSYSAGEISMAELWQFVSQAVEIRQGYLKALNEYNRAIIDHRYFIPQ